MHDVSNVYFCTYRIKVYLIGNAYVHYRQKLGVSGKFNGNTRIWHFDLLEMALHQTLNTSRKFAIGHQKTAWALKQNHDRIVRPKVQHFVILYRNEKLLNLFESCLLKF